MADKKPWSRIVSPGFSKKTQFKKTIKIRRSSSYVRYNGYFHTPFFSFQRPWSSFRPSAAECLQPPLRMEGQSHPLRFSDKRVVIFQWPKRGSGHFPPPAASLLPLLHRYLSCYAPSLMSSWTNRAINFGIDPELHIDVLWIIRLTRNRKNGP